VTWGIGYPTGETKDYIDKTSWRGVGLDIRKALGLLAALSGDQPTE
jgi:hypothetical protein